MSKNQSFYDALVLPKTCFEADLYRSFRGLSLRWHPAKNVGDTEAQERFADICEAFEVLSHWRLRSAYDRYGVGGLADFKFKAAPPLTVFKKFWEEHGGQDTVDQYIAQRCSRTNSPPTEWDTVMERLEQRHQFDKRDCCQEAVFDPWNTGEVSSGTSNSATPQTPLSAAAVGGYTPQFSNNRDRMLHEWKRKNTSDNGSKKSYDLNELSCSFKAEIAASGHVVTNTPSMKASFMNDWKQKSAMGSMNDSMNSSSGGGGGAGSTKAAFMGEWKNRATADSPASSGMDSIDMELFDTIPTKNMFSRSTYSTSNNSNSKKPATFNTSSSSLYTTPNVNMGGSIKEQMMSSYRCTTDPRGHSTSPPDTFNQQLAADRANLYSAHESFKQSLLQSHQPPTPIRASGADATTGSSLVNSYKPPKTAPEFTKRPSDPFLD